MEVFDFMPYTYYTRMTVGGGNRTADSCPPCPTISLSHYLTSQLDL